MSGPAPATQKIAYIIYMSHWEDQNKAKQNKL